MVGNIISIFIFSDKRFRSNIGSWYFICVSLSQLLLLNCACLARIVAVISGYDVSRYVLDFCKFRAYLFVLSLVLSRHFLCLISLDRWLITAVDIRFRRVSASRPTRWIIGCSIVFWSIFSIHAFIGYIGQTGGCSPVSGSLYDIFYSMYSIVTAISPIVSVLLSCINEYFLLFIHFIKVIMSVLSTLTIMNVRNSIVRRIQPIVAPVPTAQLTVPLPFVNEQARIRYRRDRQLIRLALFQVASYIVLNITTSIYPLYSYLTTSASAVNADQLAIGTFISTIGLILLYTYSAVSVHIYLFLIKRTLIFLLI